MIKPIKILNYSFRNEKLTLNFIDTDNNVHFVNLEFIELNNTYSKYRLKALYGHFIDYIGELNFFITDYLGLCSILESKEFNFTESNCNNFSNSLKIEYDKLKPNICVQQITDMLFLIIQDPKANILYNSYNIIYDFEYIQFAEQLSIDNIFLKEIDNEGKYYECFKDKTSVNDAIDYRSEERREYDSIGDDDDTKRDAFGHIWLEDQMSRAYAEDIELQNDIEKAKLEQDRSILLSKFNEIKIIDFDFDKITLVIPPSISINNQPQLTTFQMYPNDVPIEWMTGSHQNIFITVVKTLDDKQLNNIQDESNIILSNYKKYDYEYNDGTNNKYLYIFINVLRDWNKYLDKQSIDNSKLPF